MRALFAVISAAAMMAAFASNAFAAVGIYLVSRAELGESPSLGDVASVDAAPGVRRALLSLPLPEKVLEDGYVDRREVEELVAAAAGDIVLVYGNAVRVSRTVKEEAVGVDEKAADEERLVTAGEPVGVRVKKNGIVIELSGSALQNGAAGDEVAVKLKGNHTLKGRVVRKNLVELAL